MRVLIVEDSPLVQKMYGLVFPVRHHELVTALNGRAALDELSRSEQPFDLILLDLRMPDMNGVEFLNELRLKLTTAPVVLTTGEAESSPLLAEARALGPAAVVHKPWKPHELREVLQQVLGQPIG